MKRAARAGGGAQERTGGHVHPEHNAPLVFGPVTAALAMPNVDAIGQAMTAVQLGWLCSQVAR